MARAQLSMKQKGEIIIKLQENVKTSEICKLYQVNKSTISRIKNNKETIENFFAQSFESSNKVKRIKKVMVPDIEKALYAWFLNERTNSNIVTDEILRIKAIEFHEYLNSDAKFQASFGWIQKFKRRHGIRLLKISGDKLSSNDSAVPGFIQNFRQKINLLNLQPEQIYNADETGLVYKNLNDKTLVTKEEKNAPGRKNSKERITIMPCVNANGKHKLPLVVIGKAKNPRCFRDAVLPNIHYRSSRNAWQTRTLFKEWFYDVFIPLVTENLKMKNLPVKAVLLLDNATCHPTEQELVSSDGNFTVFFFPPNTTPILQPLDQHIIKSMKQIYRKKLLCSLLAKNGDIVIKLKNLNLRDVLFMISESWTEVRQSVIINGWKHLFKTTDELIFNLPADYFDEDDEIPLTQLYRHVAPDTTLNDDEILNWAAGTNESSNALITDEDILQNNQQDNNEDPVPLDIDQVINSVNILVDWAENEKLEIGEILMLRKLREKAVLSKLKK